MMKYIFRFIEMRFVRLFAWLFLLAITITGCTNDYFSAEPESDGEKVGINLDFPGLSLKATGTSVTDETIARVRVLVFDRYHAGRCVLNSLIDSPTTPFWFELNSGSYDFCFVINEPDTRTDTTVGTPTNSALNAVDSRVQLEAFNIAYTALVSPEGLYVMSAIQENVLVKAIPVRMPDGCWEAAVTYTDAAGTSYVDASQLKVKAYRLATKLNLRLVQKKDNAIITNVETAKITNLPATVPMIGGILSTQPATTEVTLTANAALPSYPADGTTYAGYTAIIPSYLFRPQDDKTQAAQLYVKLDNETTPRTMTLGHQLPKAGVETDYTLHRNTLYHVTGNVTDRLDLDITVLDWDALDVSTTLGWKWNFTDNELYLSSRSPIGLRRSGMLTADNFSLKYVKAEVLNNDTRITCTLVDDYPPMHDRDNADYNGYVDHLKNCDYSDIVLTQTGGIEGDVTQSVGADRQATLRLTFPDHSTKEFTVYLNRTELNNVIWTDRNIGASALDKPGTFIEGVQGAGVFPDYVPDDYRLPTLDEWKQFTATSTDLTTDLNAAYTLTSIAPIGDNPYNEFRLTDKKTGSSICFFKGGFFTHPGGISFYLTTDGYYFSSTENTDLQVRDTGFSFHTKTSVEQAAGDYLTKYKMQIRCVKSK